jgi:hypothetical protein
MIDQSTIKNMREAIEATNVDSLQVIRTEVSETRGLFLNVTKSRNIVLEQLVFKHNTINKTNSANFITIEAGQSILLRQCSFTKNSVTRPLFSNWNSFISLSSQLVEIRNVEFRNNTLWVQSRESSDTCSFLLCVNSLDSGSAVFSSLAFVNNVAQTQRVGASLLTVTSDNIGMLEASFINNSLYHSMLHIRCQNQQVESKVTIIKSLFEGNIVQGLDMGVISVSDRLTDIKDSTTVVQVINSTLTNNTALQGSSLCIQHRANVKVALESVTFDDNSVARGGGVLVQGVSGPLVPSTQDKVAVVDIVKCLFQNNTALLTGHDLNVMTNRLVANISDTFFIQMNNYALQNIFIKTETQTNAVFDKVLFQSMSSLLSAATVSGFHSIRINNSMVSSGPPNSSFRLFNIEPSRDTTRHLFSFTNGWIKIPLNKPKFIVQKYRAVGMFQFKLGSSENVTFLNVYESPHGNPEDLSNTSVVVQNLSVSTMEPFFKNISADIILQSGQTTHIYLNITDTVVSTKFPLFYLTLSNSHQSAFLESEKVLGTLVNESIIVFIKVQVQGVPGDYSFDFYQYSKPNLPTFLQSLPFTIAPCLSPKVEYLINGTRFPSCVGNNWQVLSI